jgi:hypothetical protein
MGLAALVSACALAQESGKAFQKAPPGVEEALKARVMQFFDMQQEGKFRQAESMVCEDTKDFYYNMDKQRHKGSQFVKLFFEDGYKQAKAQVNLDIDLNTMNGAFPAKFPMMSYWRVENANWCYFIPKQNQDFYPTPFGLMKRDPNAPRGSSPPAAPMVDVAKLKASVKPSKTELDLPAFRESSHQVELQNTLPGQVELSFSAPPLEGLKVTLDKPLLQPGETAILRFEYKPVSRNPLPPVTVRVTAGPLNQQIDIRLLFDNRPPA